MSDIDPFADFGIVPKKSVPPCPPRTPIGQTTFSSTSPQIPLRTTPSPITYDEIAKSDLLAHQATVFDPFMPSVSSCDPFTTTSTRSMVFDPFGPSPALVTSVPSVLSLQEPQIIQQPQDMLDLEDFLTPSSHSNQMKVSSSPTRTRSQQSQVTSLGSVSATTPAAVRTDLLKLREAYGLEPLDTNGHDDKDIEAEASDIFSPRIVAPHPVHKTGGRYAMMSPGASPSPVLTGQAVTQLVARDLNLPTEGSLLGRLSMRSLLVQEWKPIFWVLSSDHHRHQLPFSQNPLSLLLYRSRNDYYNFPKGDNIKKEISIKCNLNCVPIRRKDYDGYGQLHYFMLEENTEFGTVPLAKFASPDRNDVDILWINLKTQITATRKLEIEKVGESAKRK